MSRRRKQPAKKTTKKDADDEANARKKLIADRKQILDEQAWIAVDQLVSVRGIEPQTISSINSEFQVVLADGTIVERKS